MVRKDAQSKGREQVKGKVREARKTSRRQIGTCPQVPTVLSIDSHVY